RGRRDLLAETIRATTAGSPKTVQITALCSGPGDELFAALGSGSGGDKVAATLIDFDAQALAEVAVRRDQLRLGARVRLLNTNLFDLATSRPSLEVADQDLVYSINLLDSFDDRLATK